jgi:hypothetical protein
MAANSIWRGFIIRTAHKPLPPQRGWIFSRIEDMRLKSLFAVVSVFDVFDIFKKIKPDSVGVRKVGPLL